MELENDGFGPASSLAQFVAALNAAGLDLAVYGNHEFDFGPEVLAERVKEAIAPIRARREELAKDHGYIMQMLKEGTARAREMAVRLAIGASRWRLVRQMISESMLIAGFGAIGGIAFETFHRMVAPAAVEGRTMMIVAGKSW